MSKYILDLINNNEDLFIRDFKKIIGDLSEEDIINMFTKSRIIKVIINNNLFYNNLDILSKKIDAGYIKTVIDIMSRYNKDYVLTNKYKLFNYYFSYYFYREYIDYCIDNFNIDIKDIINYIKDNSVKLKSNDLMSYLLSYGYEDIVNDNIDMFINNSVCLMELKKDIMNLRMNVDNILINRVNSRMDNNIDIVLEEIISTRFDYDKFGKERILPYLKRIIYELCEQEKVNYHDIKYVGGGDFSSCFKIGHKYFKIGDKRRTFYIKNNKRLLQPLRREEIKTLNDEFMFTLEINEEVDTNNITDNDVYLVYKELRKQGIIWTDPKKANLGRLTKDNKIYFDGIDMVDKVGTGFLTDSSCTLKAGELVIIDTDFIYDEDDLDYLNHTTDLWTYFEQRYQEELFMSNIKK